MARSSFGRTQRGAGATPRDFHRGTVWPLVLKPPSTRNSRLQQSTAHFLRKLGRACHRSKKMNNPPPYSVSGFFPTEEEEDDNMSEEEKRPVAVKTPYHLLKKKLYPKTPPRVPTKVTVVVKEPGVNLK